MELAFTYQIAHFIKTEKSRSALLGEVYAVRKVLFCFCCQVKLNSAHPNSARVLWEMPIQYSPVGIVPTSTFGKGKVIHLPLLSVSDIFRWGSHSLL